MLPTFYEVIRPLPPEERLALLDAIMDYGFEGKEPEELPITLKGYFTLMRPVLEKSIRYYEKQQMNGAKGGRPPKPRENPTKTQTKPKENLDSESDSDSESEGEKENSPPPAAVVPPTIEEVTDYCKERHNSIDPQRFVNFYTAKGWMIGTSKMRDWKAAVRTWERMNSSSGDNRGEAPKGKEEVPPAARHTFVRTGEWEGYWVDENGERIE